MRTLVIALIVLTLSVVSAEASDGGGLIAKSIQTYEQIEAIRSQMRDAVGDLADEKRAYELATYELDREPMATDQLDELASEIKRHTQDLQRYKSQGASDQSVSYAKKRIRDLSLMHKAGELDTTGQREAFRAETQPTINKLSAEINAIETPYQQRIQAIQAPADENNDALKSLISTHLKAPESAFPGSKIQHLSATVHMAFGASHWQDSEGKQIAWAHIRIRSLDEIEDYHREKLLDGKYPIQSLSDGSIWVWAGNFLITFVADDESITGEANIQKAIHQFIDLESLAAISVDTEQVAVGEINP